MPEIEPASRTQRASFETSTKTVSDRLAFDGERTRAGDAASQHLPVAYFTTRFRAAFTALASPLG